MKIIVGCRFEASNKPNSIYGERLEIFQLHKCFQSEMTTKTTTMLGKGVIEVVIDVGSHLKNTNLPLVAKMRFHNGPLTFYRQAGCLRLVMKRSHEQTHTHMKVAFQTKNSTFSPSFHPHMNSSELCSLSSFHSRGIIQ